jgi:signal transduction histidine kinase
LLQATGRRVGVYLSGVDEEQRARAFASALESVRQFVRINVEQSRIERQKAARWDRRASALGIGLSVITLIGVMGVMTWLRATAFRPALELSAAVERFTRGDRAARAPERGAAELRLIARNFNELATRVTDQSRNQLAYLAGVAHDLRTPLSALKITSASISPDRPLPPEDQIRQTVSRVQRQVDRLERMVWDFLDAARIEAGTLELRPEVCDLRELTGAVVDLFRPTAPSHEIVHSVPDQPVTSGCDPLRIEQVVTNLVSNAIKYSPRGGRVEVRVESTAGQAVVSVSDQGVGISPVDVPQLFEPFRRTGTSQESIAGVGLGLFVARRIVESHGGAITVDSAPGRGSTFRLCLPAMAAHVRLREPRAEPPAPVGGSLQ